MLFLPMKKHQQTPGHAQGSKFAVDCLDHGRGRRNLLYTLRNTKPKGAKAPELCEREQLIGGVGIALLSRLENTRDIPRCVFERRIVHLARCRFGVVTALL